MVEAILRADRRDLRRGVVAACVMISSLPLFCGGCKRGDARASSAGKADGTSLDAPLAVARALRSWHQERRYRLFERYVLPEQRVLLVDTLMAFTRVLQANASAQARISAMHNELFASEFDLGSMAESMGMFSREVDFRSERIDGDRGVVTAQVCGRIPLEEFQFVRRQGRWVYAPQAPLPALPELAHQLAEGMERFSARLARGKLTEKEVHSEFLHRVLRRLRAIRSALPTSRPHTAGKPTSRPT